MGRPTKRGMPTLRRFRTVLVLAAVVATAASAHAGSTPTTYYVSPSGSDTNAGTSASPWKTVARVNRASLSPGDTVLFQGGAAFTDQPLMPPSAGTSSAPITFSSYGTGQAQIANANGAVWLPSADHDLVFDNLDLSSSNSVVFAAAGSGTGASGIVVQNSTVHDSPYSGVVVQPQDSGWTVRGNTFRHLGDCGLLIQGPNVTIDRNTITDTGWNTALTYAKHGIYAKGAGITISNNDISSAANGQAISLRFAGARVFGNTIHDTPYAVGFFPQDPANAGVSRIYYNRLWNITGWAFYYSGAALNGQPAGIDVVWDSNTTALQSRAEAVNVSEITAAHVEVANNVFTGSIGSAYRGCGTCSEHNNDWFGAATNVPAGAGDSRVDPLLSSAPTLAPSSSSPVVDKGTAATSLSYSAACDGALLHYCQASPDLGAVEYLTSSPPPPPPAADTTAPSVPAQLAFANATQTGGTLTWSASSDNQGVTGYTVSISSGAPSRTSTTTFAASGLTCATSYVFAVRAYDAAGNTSPAATVTASTAACPVPAPGTTEPPAPAKKHPPRWRLATHGATLARFTSLGTVGGRQ